MISTLDQEVLGRRANPRASYLGIKTRTTRTYSSTEKPTPFYSINIITKGPEG
jgi:hypothetical protein